MPWRTVRMSGKIGKANTFYIDFTNGNDSRSGHSMGEAWKTITKVPLLLSTLISSLAGLIVKPAG